jgi:uncharacterized protein YndB with AHSA1/START domain
MPDIDHEFSVHASAPQVFAAVATADGLNAWWTLTCKGQPAAGNDYQLGFGAGYDWIGHVTECTENEAIEWQIESGDEDWNGTRVALRLKDTGDGSTAVRFRHSGWPADNGHYRGSTYCWAMYLRLMKRHVEHGETVAYETRLEA